MILVGYICYQTLKIQQTDQKHIETKRLSSQLTANRESPNQVNNNLSDDMD